MKRLQRLTLGLLAVGAWLLSSPPTVSPQEIEAAARTVVVESRDAVAVPATGRQPAAEDERPLSVIVQSAHSESAAAAVRAVGGEITHELGIIRAVAATLTPEQLTRLRNRPGVRIYDNRTAEVAGTAPYTDFPALIDADDLHAEGTDGYGVTVAVIDSGVWGHNRYFKKNTYGDPRVLGLYNTVRDREGGQDRNGHGSHVASIILSSDQSADPDGRYQGIAPNADLVSVRAFSRRGIGTYADDNAGLDWVPANQDAYGNRDHNPSLSAPPQPAN